MIWPRRMIWPRLCLDTPPPPPPLQAKKITRLCSFRFLKQILERLKQECHWLRRVSLRLCAQCKLCLKTKSCLWHKEQKCSHEDCTHYVDINDKPFVCVNDLSSNSAVPQTWIQVSGQNGTGKFSRGNCSMFVTVFNKVIQLYWIFASWHVNGISPGFWYNLLLKKGAISRTFNTSHFHWNARKGFSQVELEAKRKKTDAEPEVLCGWNRLICFNKAFEC